MTTIATPPKGSISGVLPTVLGEKETLAFLRVLVSVAKADGEPTPRVRIALEDALAGLELPADVTLKGLFDEKIELDSQLRLFTTPDSRESLYQSTLSLVHIDGACTPNQQRVLDQVRTSLQISEERASVARRILDQAKATVPPSGIQPVNDPARRAAEVKSDVIKYSVLSSVLGAFPIPVMAVATDLAVVGVQVKMVRDIGQRWGHKVDKQAAVSLLGGLGLGTGARMAVSNLAKLVPAWGNVVGVTTAFASTWALGKVSEKYFESGMKVDVATLKADFLVAQTEGRKAYDAHKELVESKRKLNEAAVQTLGADVTAGKIGQMEYSTRIEQLA